MKRVLIAMAAAMILFFAAGAARATSYWIQTLQRPLVLTVNGAPLILSMAQTPTNPTLITKTTTSDWTSLSKYPWQSITGIQGASLTDGTSQTDWGGQATFYAVGGSPLRLWQCNYAVGSSSCSWRDVTGTLPSGMQLGNNGGLAVAWDSYDHLMFVEYVQAYWGGNYDGHLWECALSSSSTSTCSWRDVSCVNVGCPNKSVTGNIPVVIDPAAPERTYTGYPDVETYIVSTDGHLQRWRHYDGQWDSTIPLPSGTTVDSIGLQAWSIVGGGWSGTSYVAAGGYGSPGDTLRIATNASGTQWTWSQPSGGPGTIQASFGNIAEATYNTTPQIWVKQDQSGTGVDALWKCSFSGGACTWTNGGSPPSMRHGSYSYDGTRTGIYTTGGVAYLPGVLGTTALNLYGFDTTIASGSEWANHLPLRDTTETLAAETGNNIAEYTADDYDGTVMVIGLGKAYQSLDDGSTFTTTYVNGVGVNGPADDSFTFDSSGTGYNISVKSLAPSSFGLGRFIRGGSSWGAITVPPVYYGAPTSGIDRPWLAADLNIPDVLYLTYSSDVGTTFAYCNAGRASHNCGEASFWCSGGTASWIIPGGGSCQGTVGGCPLAQTADGLVWIAVPGIPNGGVCGSAPSGYSQAVGLYAVTNAASFGSPCSTPVPPTFSSLKACAWYTGYAGTGDPACSPCCLLHGTTNAPGCAPNRNGVAYVRMTASKDDERPKGGLGPLVALNVKSFREVTGVCTSTNPPGTYCSCTASSSTECREDNFVVSWDVANSRLCGASSCFGGSLPTITPAAMQPANRDASSIWSDHLLASTVVEDWGRFDTSWIDFRNSSTNTTYQMFFTHMHELSSTGLLNFEYESIAWPGILGTFDPNAAWYGDMDYHANGRDHSHFFNPLTTTGTACSPSQSVTCTRPVTSIRSSYSRL